MPGPRKSTATFSSGVVKSTCQGALDECSGGTIPDVGSLAQTLMTATQNPEWNTAQVKKKILLWLEKHVTTADDELLHRWWSSTARTNDEWTEAIKNQTTLEKFLEGLDQGSNLPEGHVKVPFTVARLRFKAWQEWIKKALKRDQRNREKASNSAAQAEKDAAQRQHSHIRCRLCDCEAKRSQGGGRMLENIVVCSRHNGQTPIAQLFPKNGSGKLAAVCAHCVVKCIRCGCTALRDMDLIQIQAGDTSMCTQGHEYCKFTVRWDPGNGITKVRDTCEACLRKRAEDARKTRAEAATSASAGSATAGPTPALGVGNGRQHRFLPPPQRRLHVITFGDLEVAKRFSRYEEADGKTAKNKVAGDISMETYVTLKRVKELCETVLPRRKRKLRSSRRDEDKQKGKKIKKVKRSGSEDAAARTAAVSAGE